MIADGALCQPDAAGLAKLLRRLGEARNAAQAAQPADHHFNLFRLLRPVHDEVRLHSRFLAELLNPAGTHGQGARFLKLWAQQLQDISFFPTDFNFEQAIVRREHRHIDLLLDDGRYWLIIENKIYAPDQDQQLTSYYKESLAQTPARQPVLYYLTLDGHAPAARSTAGLPAGLPVQLLSYDHAVATWLTSCAEATTSQPKLHHAILQYQHVVWHLTGRAMHDEKEIVRRLLEQEDYALQAAALVRNWRAIRHYVEYQFWLALKEQVSTHYPVAAEMHFSWAGIGKAICGVKKRETGYGLKFTLGSLEGKNVLFKVSRGRGLLTYGLPVNSLPTCPIAKLAALRRSFPEPAAEDPFWLAYWPNAEALNFESFQNEATVGLINPASRAASAGRLWRAVQEAAALCTSCLCQEFGTKFLPHTPSVTR